MSRKARIGFVILLLAATVSAAAAQDARARLVTVELNNATIDQALGALFKDSGLEYEIEDGAVGSVTVVLKDTPFETALQAVLNAASPPMVYQRDGNRYLIAVKKEAPATAADAAAKTEETTPSTTAEPNQPPAPVPTITPDTVVVKRTPVINGQIEPGEWDKFFSFEYAGVRATTYVNWDDNNLYAASESTAPTDLLITLDASNDGWFHGSDNYEFVARGARENEGPTLSVSRYESQGTPATGGVPLTAAQASEFVMKAGSAENSYVFEMAIPKASVHSLEPKAGRKMGLKVAVGVGDADVQWVPTAPLGEVQPVDLVSVKSSPTARVNIEADIRDRRLAAGEELVAKIIVRNRAAAASPADTIIVGGEGKTAKLIGSQLVRLEGIRPGKGHSFTFRTVIPHTAQPGSAALGVEVRAGEERIAASIFSFDIARPYEMSLDLGDAVRKRRDYYRIAVVVKNNTQRAAFGKVKLSLPEGWQFLKSKDTKEFYIPHEDAEQAVVFRVRPPDKVEGPAPVLAEAQIDKESVSASGTLELK